MKHLSERWAALAAAGDEQVAKQAAFFERALRNERWWHVTNVEAFTPRNYRPKSQTPMGVQKAQDARLYVTNNITYWINQVGWGERRRWVAEVDISATTAAERWHNVGFEYMQRPEIVIFAPTKVRVLRVIPLAEAMAEAQR